MDSPVCDHCFPKHFYLGDPVPGLHLILWRRGYHLVRPSPHDAIILSFAQKPLPMPSESASHEEIMNWIVAANAEQIVPMAHEEAHEFVQFCIDLGYNSDEHGFVRHWLTDKAGQLLAQRG